MQLQEMGSSKGLECSYKVGKGSNKDLLQLHGPLGQQQGHKMQLQGRKRKQQRSFAATWSIRAAAKGIKCSYRVGKGSNKGIKCSYRAGKGSNKSLEYSYIKGRKEK